MPQKKSGFLQYHQDRIEQFKHISPGSWSYTEDRAFLDESVTLWGTLPIERKQAIKRAINLAASTVPCTSGAVYEKPPNPFSTLEFLKDSAPFVIAKSAVPGVCVGLGRIEKSLSFLSKGFSLMIVLNPNESEGEHPLQWTATLVTQHHPTDWERSRNHCDQISSTVL